MIEQTRTVSVWDAFFACLLAAAVAVFGLMSTDKQYLFSNDLNLCGIYCKMGVHYGEYLAAQSFDKYYFQKSLLSALSYLAMSLSGMAKTPLHANYLIEIFSGLLLIGSAAYWYVIARYHALSRSAFWIGAVGLFLCQLFVKLVPYAQESPDTAALFLGLQSLYAVSCGRSRLIIPTYLLALFVQPQLNIFLAPVYILSYASSEQAAIPDRLRAFQAVLRRLCAKAKASPSGGRLVLFAGYIATFSIIGAVFLFALRPMHGRENAIPVLMPLSILAASYVLSTLLSKIDLVAVVDAVALRLSDKMFWRAFAKLAALEIVVKIVSAIFARGPIMSGTSTMKGALYAFFSFQFQAIEQPLKFLVAPIVFYGPLVALILLSLRQVKGTILTMQAHLPISCAAILFVFLFPDTESRHFIAFLPWFALFALKGRRFHPLYVALFAIVTLGFSRFYADYAPVGPDNDPYLMTWGPWYTPEVYWRSAALALALIAVMGAAHRYLKVER